MNSIFGSIPLQRGAVEVSFGNYAPTLLGGSSAAPLQFESSSGDLEMWFSNGQAGGFQYTFSKSSNTMTISNAANVGSGGMGSDVIVINDFNLAAAESGTGFLGFFLNNSLNVTAGATVGTDPPALFQEGTSQAYTLSVDTAMATAQTITVTLSGANPADSIRTLRPLRSASATSSSSPVAKSRTRAKDLDNLASMHTSRWKGVVSACHHAIRLRSQSH